jgi:hypothetical protein
VLDLASILPFETIDVIRNDGNDPGLNASPGDAGGDEPSSGLKAVRFIRMLRLMKLLRGMRGMRIFARWEARMALNYAVLSLQKYFITLLLAAHWMGCTLMLMHSTLELDCETDLAHTDDCTFLYHYQDGSLVDASVRAKYELALYFATGELMGTPFGDIVPVRSEERVFFIICHLIAGFVNAYLVGGMVSAISAVNARNQGFYASMDNLNRILREKHLTARNPELCERLRLYYIFRHSEVGLYKLMSVDP